MTGAGQWSGGRSPQTLSEAERRTVAAWAADCAEHVLPLYEVAAPQDGRPRALIARARAFARGDSTVAEAIRRRFEGGVPVGEAPGPAAAAAARAAGQAAAVAHQGAHALGAAAYAAHAAGLATPATPRAGQHPTAAVTQAAEDEIRWQLEHASPEVRAALRLLPPVGSDRAGPLGPGLLASGVLGALVRELQERLARTDTPRSGGRDAPW